MVVVRLIGGLGNQMFQYALGRRLAVDHGIPLKLDRTWFASQRHRGIDTPRDYALDGWRVKAEPATTADLQQFNEPPTNRWLALLSGVMPRRSGLIFREKAFSFQPLVLATRPPLLLIGYWQSEKYFASISDRLRDEFMPAYAACEHVVQARRELQPGSAVSLHIRRGDYVHNEATNRYHGVCSLDYYRAAAQYIAKQIQDPHFLVFSDEPQWAIDHLKLPWPTTVVQHEVKCQPHHDIWLMSQCSHHIIANSSFSWWGAWLNERPDKIVVAPKIWFQGISESTADLIPRTWVRL
jgi:hypothetical protein